MSCSAPAASRCSVLCQAAVPPLEPGSAIINRDVGQAAQPSPPVASVSSDTLVTGPSPARPPVTVSISAMLAPNFQGTWVAAAGLAARQ